MNRSPDYWYRQENDVLGTVWAIDWRGVLFPFAVFLAVVGVLILLPGESYWSLVKAMLVVALLASGIGVMAAKTKYTSWWVGTRLGTKRDPADPGHQSK